MFDDLYREEILDYAASHKYRGLMADPDHEAELDNPLCGDHLHIQIGISEEGRIDQIRYDGEGCAISQAAASMLAEHLEGRTLDEARRFTSEEMLVLLGLKLTPMRIKCGLLAWRTLQHAIPVEIAVPAVSETV